LSQNLGKSHAALSGLYIRFQPSPQAHAWGYIMSPLSWLENSKVFPLEKNRLANTGC